MANTSAADWDETSPAAGDNVSYGDDEIRYLRAAIADRLQKEHICPAGSTAGGEHLPGGCQVLEYQTAASLAALADRVKHGIGFSSDTKKLYRYDSSTNAQVLDIDHGSLSGRSDDDHPIYAKLAGASFTGAVNMAATLTMAKVIAMGTNKITGLGTPSATTDAATKAYADSSGGIGSCQVLLWSCPASGTGTETITLTGFSAAPKLGLFILGTAYGGGTGYTTEPNCGYLSIGMTDGTTQISLGTNSNGNFYITSAHLGRHHGSPAIAFVSWNASAITVTVTGYDANFRLICLVFN